ncbi:MAG: AMP-binding protein [Myxococcota bacterium]
MIDLSHARSTLEIKDGGVAEPLSWLEQSWKDPESFYRALMQTSSRLAGALRSTPEGGISLYHDLVMRHVRSAAPALRFFDRKNGWQSLSYEQLHLRASERASQWASLGIKAGSVVALLFPPGPELWVAIAACLRLGTCWSLLPTRGVLLLKQRLETLGPSHVITLRVFVPLLEGCPGQPVLEDGPPMPKLALHPPHTYAQEELAAQLFSPCRAPLEAATPCPAGMLLRRALRDFHLAYQLNPGESLAHPGAHVLQHLPLHALATLAGGGTYLQVGLEEVQLEPLRWLEQPAQTLVISEHLREILLMQPAQALPVRLWLANPEAPLQWDRWVRLIEQRKLEKILHGNLVLDPAELGAALTSRLRRGRVTTLVQPPPGLTPPADENLEALALGAEDGSPRLLVRMGQEWAYGGSRFPSRSGRLYPHDQVLALVSQRDPAGQEIVQGVLLVLPQVGVANAKRFVLLVFLGDERLDFPAAQLEALRQQLVRRVGWALGDEAVPDRVELLQMAPRMLKDQPDEGWCQRLYLSGRLQKRTQDPLYRAVRGLKAALKEAQEVGSKGT